MIRVVRSGDLGVSSTVRVRDVAAVPGRGPTVANLRSEWATAAVYSLSHVLRDGV